MENADVDQRLRDLQREYLDFLDDEVCTENSIIQLCPCLLFCSIAQF